MADKPTPPRSLTPSDRRILETDPPPPESESEAALLADMTAENAHADLVAEPKGREVGL